MDIRYLTIDAKGDGSCLANSLTIALVGNVLMDRIPADSETAKRLNRFLIDWVISHGSRRGFPVHESEHRHNLKANVLAVLEQLTYRDHEDVASEDPSVRAIAAVDWRRLQALFVPAWRGLVVQQLEALTFTPPQSDRTTAQHCPKERLFAKFVRNFAFLWAARWQVATDPQNDQVEILSTSFDHNEFRDLPVDKYQQPLELAMQAEYEHLFEVSGFQTPETITQAIIDAAGESLALRQVFEEHVYPTWVTQQHNPQCYAGEEHALVIEKALQINIFQTTNKALSVFPPDGMVHVDAPALVIDHQVKDKDGAEHFTAQVPDDEQGIGNLMKGSHRAFERSGITIPVIPPETDDYDAALSDVERLLPQDVLATVEKSADQQHTTLVTDVLKVEQLVTLPYEEALERDVDTVAVNAVTSELLDQLFTLSLPEPQEALVCEMILMIAQSAYYHIRDNRDQRSLESMMAGDGPDFFAQRKAFYQTRISNDLMAGAVTSGPDNVTCRQAVIDESPLQRFAGPNLISSR